jgi:hypothetical protein
VGSSAGISDLHQSEVDLLVSLIYGDPVVGGESASGSGMMRCLPLSAGKIYRPEFRCFLQTFSPVVVVVVMALLMMMEPPWIRAGVDHHLDCPRKYYSGRRICSSGSGGALACMIIIINSLEGLIKVTTCEKAINFSRPLTVCVFVLLLLGRINW